MLELMAVVIDLQVIVVSLDKERVWQLQLQGGMYALGELFLMFVGKLDDIGSIIQVNDFIIGIRQTHVIDLI